MIPYSELRFLDPLLMPVCLLQGSPGSRGMPGSEGRTGPVVSLQ